MAGVVGVVGEESIFIVQFSLSHYFLKIIYKPWDYCCKGHNLFLWFFVLFAGSVPEGVGQLSVQSTCPGISHSKAIFPRGIGFLFGNLKSPRLERVTTKLFSKFH